MTQPFEERIRTELRTEAARARMPKDPLTDVQRRARRQDLVRRSVGVVAAAVVVAVVAVALPALVPATTGDDIVFDEPDSDAPGTDDPVDGEPDTDEGPPGDPDQAPPAECSAAGLDPEPAPQDGLPAPVADTRARIVAAATACDYAALAAIATEHGSFTHSFGAADGDDQAESWRRAEDAGEEVLRLLVELLDRPHATVDGTDPALFAWPSAYVHERWDDVPPAERDTLRPLYDDEDFADFSAFGSYAGYRIGIAADGRWQYFVAGD